MALWLIPIFPFIGFLINGLFGRRASKSVVSAVAVGSVTLSFLWVVKTLLGLGDLETKYIEHYFTWIQSGTLSIGVDFAVDRLTAVMLMVVTGVGTLIHVYSTGYMHDEDGFYRFFAYLNLFMFSMLTLILGSNYLMMFIGWEGVGLCSYLLIGYYFHKRSAGDAAKKAFVVNRVGDWGLSIGIMLIFATFGTLEFNQVGEKVREGVMSGAFHVGDPLFFIIALALFIGATGK